jgi:hypothetical protein
MTSAPSLRRRLRTVVFCLLVISGLFPSGGVIAFVPTRRLLATLPNDRWYSIAFVEPPRRSFAERRSSSSSQMVQQLFSAVPSDAWVGDQQRRRLVSSVLLTGLAMASPDTATARGLIQFPCTTPLANVYHFLRSGTSLLEEEGMLSTNPLFLTVRVIERYSFLSFYY